jgi:Arc/MetJ-type ribon-helix-helix transcriptional regulator
MTTEIHRYKDWKVPCSVDLFLTSRYTCVLEELVRSGKEIADILVIHGALWEMRGSEMTEEERKAELVALIQERLDSEEPGIEVTPEFWKVFKRRCRERTAWLKTQTLGNTLLPDELYQYIQDKIASGQYANATEVVCAALDRLEAFHEPRGR